MRELVKIKTENLNNAITEMVEEFNRIFKQNKDIETVNLIVKDRGFYLQPNDSFITQKRDTTPNSDTCIYKFQAEDFKKIVEMINKTKEDDYVLFEFDTDNKQTTISTASESIKLDYTIKIKKVVIKTSDFLDAVKSIIEVKEIDESKYFLRLFPISKEELSIVESITEDVDVVIEGDKFKIQSQKTSDWKDVYIMLGNINNSIHFTADRLAGIVFNIFYCDRMFDYNCIMFEFVSDEFKKVFILRDDFFTNASQYSVDVLYDLN